MRSRQPDPLAADIVQMRKDRRDGSDIAGRFSSPGSRIEMFDQNLVHPIVGPKDPDCGPAELTVTPCVDAWPRLSTP